MYGDNVLNGTNSVEIQPEARAWLKVMDELASVVRHIDASQQGTAKALIHKARDALHSCASLEEPSGDELRDARESVRAVLVLFPDWTLLVDVVFFCAFSLGGLKSLVTNIEAINPTELSDEDRRRLRGCFESALEAFNQKLEGLQRDLEQGDETTEGSDTQK